LEKDLTGEETLSVIAEANNFNKWMYETIRPYSNGKTLEIGSGIGNISAFFMNEKKPIMLTDIREGYCLRLKDKFKEAPSFLGAESLDLIHPNFDLEYKKHLGRYDTVFALNVVEHIFDDELALKNCYKLLAVKGKVIILVPSYQKLFNQFDTELGHYRRYTKFSLSEVFKKTDFKIIHKQYFNFVGIFGWFVSGSVLKKKTIPKGQMRLYNSLVPIFKIVDKLIFNSSGLSTIIVGEKN